MLGKLMKYEMKATARYFLPVYAAILVFSFFIGLRNYDGPILSLLNGILPSALVLSFVGLAVITMIMVVKRFDSNLLGDEGYLMFTLPVKTASLMNSKLITSVLWIIISSGVFVLSMLLVGWRYMDAEFIRETIQMILSEPYLVFIVLTLTLMTVVNFLLHVYASLSIAQGYTITRSRILGGTIVFVVISTMFNIFETFLLFLSGLLIDNNSQWFTDLVEKLEFERFADVLSFFKIMLTIVLIYITLKNILFYFLTKYHLNKKLNLE